MTTVVTIRAGRVRLDALVETDAPGLFAYRSLPEVARYQGWVPQRVEDAASFIARQATTPFRTPGTWFQLGVRDAHDGSLLGDLGLHFPDDTHGPFEFGVSLRPEAQGRGYACEAASAVLDAAFSNWGYRRAVASVDPRNVASVGLLKALGFRQEAHHRESYWFRGEWADDLVFAMLAAEWKAATHR